MSRFSKPGIYLTPSDIERLGKEFFGPEKPREIDYLAYMIDECNLNAWQQGAFKSMLEYLQKSGDWLSAKQRVSVIKAIDEFNLYGDDVKKGFLHRNWADDVSKSRGTVKTPVAKPKPVVEDDYDDDIPF
jgi:hypothetical protein